jgi:hypothetical protein
VTKLDIFLDVSGTNPNQTYVNDTRFDFSSAINMPDGSFRRDFVFNGGYYNDAVAPGSGPRFVISESNNAGRGGAFPKNPGRNPFVIAKTGWYTFVHRFYNNGSGVLAVDLSILDSMGNVLTTSTLSDPSDIIGVTVGGNRYGWIAANEFNFLAIDNASLAINSTITSPVDAYQIIDPSNLLIGDSYVNLTNAGTRNGFDPAGGICANIYVFDPSEELIACCACYVSPDGLRSLSAKQDLVSNTLTPGVPGSIVIKLLTSTPPAGPGSCNPSSPTIATLEPGLRAWGTDLHQNTTTGAYRVTENPAQQAVLSVSELAKLTTFCGFIQANGSTFGICKSCRFGGLGGAQQ